ncbi:restriction endonuclease subunit S [Acinetobacter baumannii]|nr:restriction endonuclease subunit S [Acinetobacter baumannii]MDC5239906.1 restriction endonuclease subunit S [Acinetobacter baumannii]TPS90630.1 restriction endonuclease subunit S [Acinetobacter baumannii]HEN9552781.1 restriction endonuclease subunit S [Acinetobacter baumannii]
MAVPKLRFKEFDRDWTTQSLGNVTDITKLAGYEFTKHINYQDSGEIIALRGLNVKGNNLVLEDVKYIDNSDLSMLSRSKLYIDDLLFTYVGTIGEVALIPENDKFYLAPNVCRIRRVNKNILSKYLMFLFSNDNFKKNQIDKYTTKSSQPALSMENIRKFEIVFPSVEEQTKITSFLSTVDEKISQLTQKHELLNQYKQGMMQKLFSQQIRFKADDGSEFGEWENGCLGDITAIQGGYAFKSNSFGKGATKVLRIGDIRNKIFLDCFNGVYSEEIPDARYVVSKDAIVMALSGATFGKLGKVVTGSAYLNQRVATFKVNEKTTNEYVYQVMLSKDFFNYIQSIPSASAQPNISNQDVINFEILIPCLEEQTKIANFLSAIDQKIEVVAQQIEQAKTWKKGLLQQMFI